MTEYNFKYEDDIIREPDVETSIGVKALSIMAKNRKLFKDCPIEYDTSTGKCYIYSNEEIPGLKLVGTDEVKQRSKVVEAEVEAMSVTIQEV